MHITACSNVNERLKASQPLKLKSLVPDPVSVPDSCSTEDHTQTTTLKLLRNLLLPWLEQLIHPCTVCVVS